MIASFDRITFEPDTMRGQTCIRGLRIPVSLIIKLVAHGKTMSNIIAEYPDLTPEDISQSLEYAARLAAAGFDKGAEASSLVNGPASATEASLSQHSLQSECAVWPGGPNYGPD